MRFLFFVNIVALLFSFFVAGVLIGVILSRPFREQLAKVLHLELLLSRSARNPILTPGKYPWTAEAVMNPAAAIIDGRTHLVYRAIGMDGVSRLGYASSADGVVFDERLPYPIYAAHSPGGVPDSLRRYSPVLYPSGGSWGGCEDPRMVVIGDRVYVTFNMFENWNLRVGVISLGVENFLAKRFGRWEGPIVLSGGNQNKSNSPLSSKNRDKNWTLFPEKIGGRFAILHTVIDEDPNRVRIAYTDTLEDLLEQEFDTIDPQKVPDERIAWHVHVRSAGPPPIKTDRGWLVFYHASTEEDKNNSVGYRVGAMLLDLTDPTKILYRAAAPVLSPDEYYENDGKPGVVFACGAVVHDGTLFVYYGGADKVVCVATAPLETFLDALIAGGQPSLAVSPAQTK